MKVKMLVCMVGPKVSVMPDDEYICGDAEAQRLIDAGYAVPVAAVKLERAVKPKAREVR